MPMFYPITIHYESGRPMDNIVQRLDNVAKDPWVFESLVYDELRPGVSTTPETNILLKEEFQVLRKVARIMTLLGKQIYYNRKGLPDAMEHRPVRFEDFINEPWNFEDYTSMAYHDSTVGSTTSAATNSIVPTTTATINKDELQTLKKVARILAGLGNEVHNKSTTLPETTEHSTIEFEDLTRESWNFDDYTSVASEDMKIDATSTPTSTVVQEMRDLKKDICKRIESIENNKHTTVTFEDVTTVSSTINTSTSKTREESTIASINTSSSASTTITGSEIVAKDIIKALRKVSKILVILGEQVIPEIIGETSVINNLQQKP
ncbi:unnamed protein product, partial [Iphiclides podalirius]